MAEKNNRENESKSRVRITFWDYLLLLLKWRKTIILNVFAVGLIVAIISLFIPSWFLATTTILPPSKDTISLGSAGAMLGGLGSLLNMGGTSGGFLLPALTTPSDLYASLLRSKAVVEKVIEENNLEEEFDAEGGDKFIEEIKNLTSISIDQTGILSLSFESKDPELSASVANSYIDILDELYREINSRQAANTREFVGAQLEKTEKDLERAEENMREFQEEYGAIDLTEQLRVQIQNAAELQAQLVMAEIELGVALETMSPDNSAVRRLQSKIDQIKRQLKNMEEPDIGKDDTTSLMLPFSKAPELGLEFIRLTRELKIQETLFELLKTQYEQAKISEAKDTPVIQVLDQATPPEKRSRPTRIKLVAMGILGSLVFSLIAVFVYEYFQRLKAQDKETFDKFHSVATLLQNDINSVGKIIFKKKTDTPSQE
ncbi:MAG: hypothetical protein GF315_08230 [candidate division Zixibacteria bacterium]|nr:hypothetical protein [candidate division Zixibacteria bacterium]